jgi:outer membrane protein assembly factor BamD
MKPSARSAILVLALAVPPALAACATTPVRSNLNYADRARRDYEAAMELFEGGDYVEATERFQQVRREYGLSRWAWLAELRLADIDFRQEKYSSAITAYRSWIRYHPTQPEVVYAHFMIAKSYFAEIPTDWALVPASWERDQSSTHDAEDALQRFLQDYGSSQYAAEARELLRRTRELLARAEIHIAEFYLSRERPEAAISRLRGVLETYAGSGLEPEALLKIGETYLQMGRRAEAREAFTGLVNQYPRSGHAEAARRYLRFLGAS